MNEFIDRIRKLRNEEGIPLHFRRSRGIPKAQVLWYIWYGYVSIATRADQKTAEQAVNIAVNVHREIYSVSNAA